ncbi:zeta toxin family protein [Daejeonella sp.]|uniref:zeta toxin family protein n=1 Tax=Daejeonella sp. TaxID=2805397 RepID=UPI0039834DB1
MTRPRLYVFAGPNGAGKSTMSADMLPSGTPIFDGDKEFAKLKLRFNQTDSGNLIDALNDHVFPEWKRDVQQKVIDCAFETNFRTADVMKSVMEFRKKGYEVNLIYFGLESLEASIERVNVRVALGGHKVSLENLTANYVQGFENLKTYVLEFDNVLLVSSLEIDIKNNNNEIYPYLKIEMGKITDQADLIPEWVESILEIIALR